MGRKPTVVLPDEDVELEDPNEPTEIEMEQAAAGDITLLGDPTFNDYHWSIWRQRTRAEIAGDPRAPSWEFITKAVGPIDATSMIHELGGGVFEFRGYVDVGDGRGKRMKRHPVIALAGPRRNFAIDASAPVPAVVTTTPTPSADPMMIRMSLVLEAMERRLNSLERQPVTPTKSEGIGELVGALKDMDEIRGHSNGGGLDPTTVLEVLRQGIALGEGREPSAPNTEAQGTDWGKILENLFEMMSRGRRPTARVVQPPPGPSPPPTSSRAEVVEPPVIDPGAARWMVAIDRLESLMPDADEAAEEIGVILTDQDLQRVLPFANDAVIAQIVARVPSTSVLTTPDGRAYLALVLDELRKPDSGD